ncbi:P63C domain-containing protein [Clostridium sp.]|uniref:P63C domain-containing protein n=1 Tax=Clostridium sp. TaxID=1506 RepID=UPI001B545D56|nr:P63C domain-containing protein [Clostridium sp.]MBP3916020.1 hypothetical protein [Clostridium sp.]
MENIYVYKALKMPHTDIVGYYMIGQEKIPVSVNTDKNKQYFNIAQKDIVEQNKEFLILEHIIQLPRAVTRQDSIILGNASIDCCVLNDGTRVIKDTALFNAIGRTRKGETRIEGFDAIIGAKNIAQVYVELYGDDKSLINRFEVAEYNGTIGLWYDATALTMMCDLYLELERQGLLAQNQIHVLERCKILLRSLAKVGIIALIDEATDYQDERGKDELQLLLSKFITEELQNYSNEFPAEYFEQLFRLYGLEYDPTTNKRPRYFAKFNLKYVYDMLAPNCLEELNRINPPIYNANTNRKDRKHRMFRNLTESGIKELREHLKQLLITMKFSEDINDFRNNKFPLAFSEKLEKLEKLKEKIECDN